MTKDSAVRKVARILSTAYAYTVAEAADRLTDAARKTGASVSEFSACIDDSAPPDTGREREHGET